jgi:hypothetical protein
MEIIRKYQYNLNLTTKSSFNTLIIINFMAFIHLALKLRMKSFKYQFFDNINFLIPKLSLITKYCEL